jgi:hypothetical protein
MNDTSKTTDHDQADEEILTATASDEALEVVGGTQAVGYTVTQLMGHYGWGCC